MYIVHYVLHVHAEKKCKRYFFNRAFEDYHWYQVAVFWNMKVFSNIELNYLQIFSVLANRSRADLYSYLSRIYIFYVCLTLTVF